MVPPRLSSFSHVSIVIIHKRALAAAAAAVHTHTRNIIYSSCYTTTTTTARRETCAHEKGNKNAAALARLSVGWLTFFKVLDAVFRSS